MVRQPIDPEAIQAPEVNEEVLLLDEALSELAGTNPAWAELVKLRYFAGLTIPEAAHVLGVSPRTADSWWSGARAWLRKKIAIDLDEALA